MLHYACTGRWCYDIYLIAKLLYILASGTCVVVEVVVVDDVVVGFEDNKEVDTVFYRECIEGYVN